MSWDDDALACVDVDTFTLKYLDEFEGAKPFNFDGLVVGYVLNDCLEELAEERFGILL